MPACIRYRRGKVGHYASSYAKPQRRRTSSSRNVARRPGGQVTGILASLDTLPGKQLEIGREAVHGVTKIGFLYDTSNSPLAIVAQRLEAAAASLNIMFVRADVSSPHDLEVALQRLSDEHVGLVFVPQSPLFFTERSRIAALAIAIHLPTLYGFREHVEEGGLISYNINMRENFRRAATFIDKIMRGAKPGDLPIELPTKLEPEDCQDARNHYSTCAACSRRRGDRVRP
jgi:putative tryptophan/tyrosine transport system substrate-binding protein